MPLDPAPPLLGSDVGAGRGVPGSGAVNAVNAAGPVIAVGGTPVGDEARLRATARRQWLGRRALERQLHDGAALRISALTLRLGLLRHAVPGAGQEFRQAVEGLQDELHLVLQELRDVAGLLYPPLLDEAGLGPALREAVAQCPVPVRVEAPDERFGPAVEGAAYYALLACLPSGVPDCRSDGAPDTDGQGDGGWPGGTDGRIDLIVRRDGDALVLLVTGVPTWQAGPVHDVVRTLGGTVAVGGVPVGASTDGVGDARVDDSAPITVRIPCA